MIKTIVRKMSSVSTSGRHLIAVAQMTSGHDLEANLSIAQGLLERAKQRNCECFDYIGRSKDETITLAFPEQSDILGKYKSLAKSNNMWLSLGGFHNKDSDNKMPLNSHIVIDSTGNTRGRYDKLHLFDLDIPGVRLMESEFSRAGPQLVKPVETPVGTLGLSICYDVRFAELALWNRCKGAQLLSYPSSFTVKTGLAHWEALLRARAIETQCYVVASAQTGDHNPKRSSYGHSMVIDPWGAIIAQCSERVDLCFAEIDLDYVAKVRQNQPVMAHRRSDLYRVEFNEKQQNDESLKFSEISIPKDQIFLKTGLSYAFVNLKPVVPGHVLISPIRQAKRLTDLTDSETSDLFNTSKRVQRVLEEFYQVEASTICVQDGAAAGQTVPHVHVHILPRKAGDFGDSPDSIYKEIERDRQARNNDQMAKEADLYRPYFA